MCVWGGGGLGTGNLCISNGPTNVVLQYIPLFRDVNIAFRGGRGWGSEGEAAKHIQIAEPGSGPREGPMRSRAAVAQGAFSHSAGTARAQRQLLR